MKFLPSLFGTRRPVTQVKGAVDRRHSAGSYYSFEGVPTVSPAAGALEVETAVKDAWGRVIWVYRAIDARAKNASRLNVKIMDGRGPDAVEIPDHRLAYLLNRTANPYESGQAFRYRLHTLLDLSLRGVPVEVVEARNGTIDSLHILNPQITFPIPDPNRFLAGWEMRLPSGETMRLPVYERGNGGGVLWIRRPHPTDPYASSSWLQAAGISIDLDYYARVFNLRFLQNDGRPGGVLSVKGEDGLDPADAVELQRRMSGGPDSAGKVTILEAEHLEYTDLATNPRDAQYVESRALTQREILVAAGTPLSVIGDASGRTFDNADAEMESFWRIEMIPECDMVGSYWEELTDDGRGGDEEVVTYDYDSITVLQRDKRAREQAKQAEVAAGLATIDEYREVTNQEPFDLPGTRVLWAPAGKAPIGEDADVVALLSQGQAPPPDQGGDPGGAPALPPPPDGPVDGEVVDAGNPDQDAVPMVLDEAQYAEQKALPKDGPGEPADSLIEARRKAHAELIAAWEEALSKELIALCHRQEQVILARLKGAKARRHTRHWTGDVPEGREVKALDPAYIADRRTWIDHVVTAIASVVKAAFGAAGEATAKQLGSEWEPGKEAPEIIAKTVRAIAEGFDARAGRLQEIIEVADGNGDDIKTIAEKVRKAFISAPTWAAVSSRSVVGAMNAASLIAAVDAGALEKRWLATDDERTRPTHLKAEGQVVAIDEEFKVGKGTLDFPGDPTGPPAEWVNCRCTMLFALGARNDDEDLDEDLAALDEFEKAEWKAARAFRAFAGIDIRFDPSDHPRDYRGRFIDVPDVTLPDGTQGVAISQDDRGNVTVAKADGDVVTARPETLTQMNAAPLAKPPTYEQWREGAAEGDLYQKDPETGGVITVTRQDDGVAWSAWTKEGEVRSGTAPDRYRAEGRAKNALQRMTGTDRPTREVGDVTAFNAQGPLAQIVDVRHGIEFQVHVSDTRVMSGPARETAARDIDEVLARLPDLTPPVVQVASNPDVFAAAGGWPNPKVDLGAAYDSDATIAQYAKQWANGLSIAGGRDVRQTRRAVMVHEMGHNVQRHIEHLSPEAKQEIDDLIDEPVSARSLGFSGGDNLDGLMPRWKIDGLSTSDRPRDSQSAYANEYRYEWFAEAFADGYLNGDQASESGKRAYALARKHLGGDYDTREAQAVPDRQAAADAERDDYGLVSAPPSDIVSAPPRKPKPGDQITWTHVLPDGTTEQRTGEVWNAAPTAAGVDPYWVIDDATGRPVAVATAGKKPVYADGSGKREVPRPGYWTPRTVLTERQYPSVKIEPGTFYSEQVDTSNTGGFTAAANAHLAVKEPSDIVSAPGVDMGSLFGGFDLSALKAIIDAMPDGPDKEGQQRLYDTLNRHDGFAAKPLAEQKDITAANAQQAALDFHAAREADPTLNPLQFWYGLDKPTHKRDLPTYAIMVVSGGQLDDTPEGRELLMSAWQMSEWPEGGPTMGRFWREAFARVGFATDDETVTGPPEGKVTLYRGSTERGKRGMAWTTNFDTAAWFASRFGGGGTGGDGPPKSVWTMTVDGSKVLAVLNGRGEHEYVTDTTGATITRHPDFDPDKVYGPPPLDWPEPDDTQVTFPPVAPAPTVVLPDETFDKVQAALASLPSGYEYRMFGRYVMNEDVRYEQLAAENGWPERMAAYDKAIAGNEKSRSTPPTRHKNGAWIGQPIYTVSKGKNGGDGNRAVITGYLIPQEAVDDRSWPGYSLAVEHPDYVEVVTPRGKPIKPDMVMTPKGSDEGDWIQATLTNNRDYLQHQMDATREALAGNVPRSLEARVGGPNAKEVEHLDTILEVGHAIYDNLPSIKEKAADEAAYHNRVQVAAAAKAQAIELSDRLHTEYLTHTALDNLSPDDYTNLIRPTIPDVISERTPEQQQRMEDLATIHTIPYDWQTSAILPLQAVQWGQAADRLNKFLETTEGWDAVDARRQMDDPTLPDIPANDWHTPDDLPMVYSVQRIGTQPEELVDAITAFKQATETLKNARIAYTVRQQNRGAAIHAEVTAALAQIRDMGGTGLKVQPRPAKVSKEYGPDPFRVGRRGTRVYPDGLNPVLEGSNDGMTDELSDEIKSYLESGSRVYPTDWVEATNNAHGGKLEGGGVVVEVSPRAYYSKMNNAIALSGHTADYLHTTAVHEVGHSMETAIPGLEEFEWAMFWARTHDRQPDGTWVRKPGPQYLNTAMSPGEYGIKDDWKNHYTGKWYSSAEPDAMPDAKSPKEMFTTIVQGLLGGDDPYEYGDDEMNAWALGLLATLGTPQPEILDPNAEPTITQRKDTFGGTYFIVETSKGRYAVVDSTHEIEAILDNFDRAVAYLDDKDRITPSFTPRGDEVVPADHKAPTGRDLIKEKLGLTDAEIDSWDRSGVHSGVSTPSEGGDMVTREALDAAPVGSVLSRPGSAQFYTKNADGTWLETFGHGDTAQGDTVGAHRIDLSHAWTLNPPTSDVVSAPPVGDVDGWLRARALRDGRRAWERDDPPEYWVDNAVARMPRPQTVATTGDTTVAVMGKSKGPGGRRTIPFDQAKVQTLLTHAEWLRTNLPTDEAVPVEVVVRPPGKWENEDWAMRASRGQSQELGAIVIGVNQDEAMGPFWHDDVAEKANFPAGNALMPSARGLPDSVYSLTHEWGHVHDNRTKAQVVEDEQILTDPGLSDYGRYHSHEAYAEAYAEWVHTGGQSTNSAVLYFAQKYGWAIPEATP